MMTATQSGSQNLYFHERLCRRQEFPKSSCCIDSIAKTYIYHFIIGKKGKQTMYELRLLVGAEKTEQRIENLENKESFVKKQ